MFLLCSLFLVIGTEMRVSKVIGSTGPLAERILGAPVAFIPFAHQPL
jgi:hypothetical protein